jgi:hypothetical protein
MMGPSQTLLEQFHPYSAFGLATIYLAFKIVYFFDFRPHA